MKKSIVVYLAGPITKPMVNVNAAIAAADQLLAAVIFPIVPHLTVLWDMISPHNYERWMELDFAHILRCDALVRIPGPSEGSDREVVFALEHNIPVYYGVEKAIQAFGCSGRAPRWDGPHTIDGPDDGLNTRTIGMEP